MVKKNKVKKRKASRKPPEWIRLAGQLFLNSQTGQVQMRYGKGGWHRMPLGNIRGTKTFRRVKETYGTKEGSKIRRITASAIMKSLKFSKPK